MNITNQTFKNPFVICLILLLGYFCIKGILLSYKDSKDYLVDTALEERGIYLRKEERIVIAKINQLDSTIALQEQRLPEIDYQQYKKRTKSYGNEPITNSQTNNEMRVDGTAYNPADSTKSLITKWKRPPEM